MDTHVLHGYDMADLQEIARIAVMSNRSRLMDLDLNQAIDNAWEGVVEKLLTADEKPTRVELIFAGYGAAARDQKRYAQMTGVPSSKQGTGSQFARYWQQIEKLGMPESCVDPIAFRQIWPMLTNTDRQVLKVHALADHSPRRGAEMLGMSKRAYEAKLSRARAKFARYWHEGETPRPIHRSGVRRPGAGFAAAA